MGIGSYLSKYIGKGLISKFVLIELLVGVIGGYSAATLFLVFSFFSSFRAALYFLVVLIGIRTIGRWRPGAARDFFVSWRVRGRTEEETP